MNFLDTLTISRRFTNAGMTPEQADVLSETFREAQEQSFENLSNKADIKDVRNDIARLETKIDTDIERSDSKTEAGFALVRKDIYFLRWMSGLVLAGVIALFSRLSLPPN